ncbi:MAG: exodeoxyribonuclease VII large subunit [Sphingomonadaceae bacterium]|uniref:exodeoxyribonuclease VII large subunit n=1 Tax=Thermaurantiacus sp. TaxID=2820283 RepID=UPI00298F1046|nr:exodeoxyribonuclease VII large subunit [Thermaurantiacus sp.]MCS6987383.1 exodeoxyribonuclease VII large subunit [Sphingomonadaceae bacterium]MDW8415303.1 exodeoxyribonuclease VII large subunit [Thermaurantiacus sp.]
MATAPSNLPELSVSELAQALKRTVETAFGLVRVRGELSGFKRHASSGHCYFALKDANAVLDAVMWRSVAQSLRFAPEDGLEVVATGRLTTFPGRSRYQLVVDRLEVAGVGALLAQVEERRRRLAAEGLFDPARKRPLPFLPRCIGIVTSPQGAVIRDILHRLADRFPRDVLLWPVPVQGEGAELRIAAAIRGFNRLPEDRRPDLLIVARGGGSVEDLMPFNTEAVVRAAAESRIPLISAVGHETDTTLLDHAADRRAPTPTAAAEMAVPVRAELVDRVMGLGLRMRQAGRRAATIRRERLEGLSARLPRPMRLVEGLGQRLDDATERLPRALKARAAGARSRFDTTGAALPRALAVAVGTARARLATTAGRLQPRLLRERVRFGRQALDAKDRLITGLSPQGTLGRGYALVLSEGGRVLADATAVRAAPRVRLRLRDGEVGAIPDPPHLGP